MAKDSEATLLLKIKATGEKVLSETADALSSIAKIAAGAFAAATAAATAAIHAYQEQEEATNSLNQALINQGIYSKDLSGSYQKMAQDLQKVTTFGDEQIVSAQAQLQQYIGQVKVTKELTTAVLDFATAQKMDLNSAAEVVGKAIGTNTNMLKRQGIEVDENADKSKKLTEVIEGLNRKFGGQAAAAAQGLGSLAQMKNALGDVLELMGEKLAPVVTYAAREITKFAYALQNNAEVGRDFVEIAKAMGKTGAYLQNSIVGLGEVLGALFGTIVAAISQLSEEGGVRKAFETIKSGFSSMVDGVVDRYDNFIGTMEDIDEIYADVKAEEGRKELQRIEDNDKRKKEILNQQAITDEEFFRARDEKELNRLMTHQDSKVREQIRAVNLQINNETDQTKKLELEMKKREMLDDAYIDNDIKRKNFAEGLYDALTTKRMKKVETSLNDLSALQNSKNKHLVAIGKAAAIANIAINTAQAATGAVAAFATPAMGIPGIALGYGAAGLLVAYGAERAASLAGIELAEGGIVKATPGGVHAIIGEGGRDEMVIPLEKGSGAPNLGTKISIQVYGGFLGNDAQAKEFAVVLDKELMKLRQSNESLAFDKGII